MARRGCRFYTALLFQVGMFKHFEYLRSWYDDGYAHVDAMWVALTLHFCVRRVQFALVDVPMPAGDSDQMKIARRSREDGSLVAAHDAGQVKRLARKHRRPAQPAERPHFDQDRIDVLLAEANPEPREHREVASAHDRCVRSFSSRRHEQSGHEDLVAQADASAE